MFNTQNHITIYLKEILMKRSSSPFPLTGLFCDCMENFWNDGVFDEYSDDHFLIRAIYQDDIYFQNLFIEKNYRTQFSESFGINFIMNLNSRINFLCKHFGKDKIANFLRNQFSAGKQNYSEKTFFEALAEIHVLAHFLAFTAFSVTSAEYEPCLVENSNHNPEARIKYSNNLTLDIEVKTPNFPNRTITTNYLFPATLLTNVGRKLLSDCCKNYNIELRLPRVLKIKEFIESAGSKFTQIETKKHINMLFINWSYTDMWENPLFEPVSLLCNGNNGILITDAAHNQIELNELDLQKISAFFIYTIPEETLLFSDFRYLFRDRCYRIIVNPYAPYDSADLIHNLTRMAVNYPQELSKNLTSFFNLEDKDWSNELMELGKIIDENTIQ